MCFTRNLSHDIDILALDRLLDEKGLIWLEGFDQEFGVLRADRAVKIDGDGHVFAARFAESNERGNCFLNEFLIRDHTGLSAVLDAGFEGRETFGFSLFETFGVIGHVGINTDFVAGGTTKQFVNWNAQKFPFDVPEGLFDAAQHARKDRAAAIKRMTINRLPVKHDKSRILSDQIRFEF